LEQLTLFTIDNQVKKRVHNDIPSYFKPDKVKQNIKKWNTIKHIYRYQTLYKICTNLYLLTFNNQLACLNYYSDTEIDCDKTYTVMYAEIDNTSALSIKERLLAHIKLLRDIKNDVELEHDIKKVDSDCVTLFG
jgi:hypothetical protein